MSGALDTLAAHYGIVVTYKGLDGVWRDVPDETKVSILAAMGVAADSEAAIADSLGRAPHLEQPRPEAEARCFIPEWLERERDWGIALQLYALRSHRNWGIGDFADLAAFSQAAARSGADFLGVNPLHALFLADPERRSPFSPSNRRFLNPLYIAVDAVPGFEPSMADAGALEAVRDTEYVDYRRVAELKLAALRMLRTAWQAAGRLPDAYAHQAFEEFVGAGGEHLRRHALFEALSLALVAEGYGSGWETWPEPFHRADSEEIAAFAAAQAEEIAFHCWLQWLASVQLEQARDAAHAQGMRIALYLDLAVGEAPDGSATWGEPSLTMRNVHIGAPPDYFSANGQDWRLAPLSPEALLGRDLASYRDMLSDSMRYGGALRLDHAMGIQQLFLVPSGRSPAEGAYVRYPLDQIVEAIASASHRHRTVVIGEDLGNVPEGFRHTMARAAMLSYRILYFERHGSGFISVADYPRDALACLSTHDLPTFEGWWRGEDIHLRHRHELIDEEAADAQTQQRGIERQELSHMLVQAGLLALAEAEAARQAADSPDRPLPAELTTAIHRLIARSPARMLAARIEDLTGEREPVNLPGTIDSYPNWQRKLATPIEDIAATALFREVTKALAEERPRHS